MASSDGSWVELDHTGQDNDSASQHDDSLNVQYLLEDLEDIRREADETSAENRALEQELERARNLREMELRQRKEEIELGDRNTYSQS